MWVVIVIIQDEDRLKSSVLLRFVERTSEAVEGQRANGSDHRGPERSHQTTTSPTQCPQPRRRHISLLRSHSTFGGLVPVAVVGPLHLTDSRDCPQPASCLVSLLFHRDLVCSVLLESSSQSSQCTVLRKPQAVPLRPSESRPFQTICTEARQC